MTRLLLPLLALTLLFACPGPDDTGPAQEVCDGIDNDGDGQVDEGFALFVDHDGDGYGSESDDSCDGVLRSGDCDDLDPATFPDGDELCDGIDNDCDGDVDDNPVDGTSYWVDADNDGYGGGEATMLCDRPSGYILRGGDCDDGDGLVHPDAVDVYNDVDDDCDGAVDGDGTLCGMVPDPTDARECPAEQIIPPGVVVDSTATLEPLYLSGDHEADGCEFGDVTLDRHYLSGDVVYSLYVPPDTECTVTLDDSCDSRMDAFVKRVDENCAHNPLVRDCGYIDSGSTVITPADFGRLFDIIVGASDGPGAPFELTVSC